MKVLTNIGGKQKPNKNKGAKVSGNPQKQKPATSSKTIIKVKANV